MVESSFAAATEMLKEAFEQVAKDRRELDEEKKKWEEEKALMHKHFVFDGPRIVLNVGGVRYSTSCSTLKKYPESMLGIMFSGRHDLESMKCEDGSFFIDRDGTHFRHILNFLRDGEEVVNSFSKSIDVLLELYREAEYYQLEGLTSVLIPLLRENDVVTKNQIIYLFLSGGATYYLDCGSKIGYNTGYYSKDKIVFKYKNKRGLSFNGLQFAHAVSFIGCDLTDATFQCCCFESDAIFEDCILVYTKFARVKGLVFNFCKVSFTGSRTDKTLFESSLENLFDCPARFLELAYGYKLQQTL